MYFTMVACYATKIVLHKRIGDHGSSSSVTGARGRAQAFPRLFSCCTHAVTFHHPQNSKSFLLHMPHSLSDHSDDNNSPVHLRVHLRERHGKDEKKPKGTNAPRGLALPSVSVLKKDETHEQKLEKLERKHEESRQGGRRSGRRSEWMIVNCGVSLWPRFADMKSYVEWCALLRTLNIAIRCWRFLI
jgi:hypothetical protein